MLPEQDFGSFMVHQLYTILEMLFPPFFPLDFSPFCSKFGEVRHHQASILHIIPGFIHPHFPPSPVHMIRSRQRKIMWHYILFLLFALLWTLSRAAPSPNTPMPPGGFSLAVNSKGDASRNFVRDWAAARHKWGRGVSRDVASTFSMSDSREPFLTACLW